MNQNQKDNWRYIGQVKLKLPIKIFLAFFTVAIVGIGMVVTASSYFANKNFESYLQFKGMEPLGVFSDTLAKFYNQHGGWESLAISPEIWKNLVLEQWPGDEKRLTGATVLLISIVIAFLLTKHLLRPIKRVTDMS